MPVVRFVLFLFRLIRFVAAAALLRVLNRDERTRRARVLRLAAAGETDLLKIMKIQVNLQGAIPTRVSPEGRLIVANHISYLDVAVLGSLFRAQFVTSTEVERQPGLGLVCRFAECLFVSRRSPARLRSDLARLRESLAEGNDVVVFPEATSSRGSEILPFHRGLLNVGSTRIIPVVIRYSRPEAAYVDDDDFVPHLWRLSKTKGIQANVTLLPERAWHEEATRESTHALHEEMSSAGHFKTVN